MSDVSLQEKIIRISETPLFSGIKANAQALEFLANLMNLRVFKSNTKLIETGVPSEELLVVIDGQVSVYKQTADGDIYKVIILKAQDHPTLGEGGLIEAEAGATTVVTDTEVTCLSLSRRAFGEFSVQHPDWALPIMKHIAGVLMSRLRQTSHDLMLLHKALMTEVRGE